MLHFKKLFFSGCAILILSGPCFSQAKSVHRFYFSWGYNKEWYADNAIHINQPLLGNDYKFVKAKGVDKPGWNTGIFNKDLTIPQYNYRLGYLIDEKWAVEINFDHTKYQIPDQILHIIGIYQGKNVDSAFARTTNNLSYQLNNGANFFLFNAIRRIKILNPDSAKVNVRVLIKGGIGFVYPHVANTIMGQDNNSGFQFGGFDAGIETGIQAIFLKQIYLEYSIKTVYAAYQNLKIYQGTARQNLACFEMILSGGVWF